MNKGQTTREDIIKKAAVLFNRQGFAGVSLSTLMAATGLKKGGLYNHFSRKEEMMAEAADIMACWDLNKSGFSQFIGSTIPA